MKVLIKQAILLPLYFFIPVFIAGLLTEGYDPIRQHASEISITEFEGAKIILSSGAILTGISFILFGIWMMINNRKKMFLSSGLLIVFGVSMISNGLYPMGNPMHGLYGIGLSLMLLPFATCYELKGILKNKKFFNISIIIGFFIFFYFWAMLIKLEPVEYRGLTQRLGALISYGWVGYTAFLINKNIA